MIVETHSIEGSSIANFAEKHGLVMEVRERKKTVGDPSRYYASFRGAEVSERGMLIGAYGNGATHVEAIAAYANEISMKKLVFGAFSKERREIEVPRLI